MRSTDLTREQLERMRRQLDYYLQLCRRARANAKRESGRSNEAATPADTAQAAFLVTSIMSAVVPMIEAKCRGS